MFKAMLEMSIKTLEAIATEILTLLVVKVFSVQNNGDIAKRRGQKRRASGGTSPRRTPQRNGNTLYATVG